MLVRNLRRGNCIFNRRQHETNVRGHYACIITSSAHNTSIIDSSHGAILHSDTEPAVRIHFRLCATANLDSRGKTRLSKWYSPYNDDEKIKLKGEIHRLVAPRDQKHQSNFVEFRGSSKIVYRRYAGLFFCACVDANDNELAYLEAIHFFVEVLDQFFGNVCELDLVFNFYKVRYMVWKSMA